ncbi:MAG: hypothetical protein ACP5R2_13450, partial [Anaerolineae bacterium]
MLLMQYDYTTSPNATLFIIPQSDKELQSSPVRAKTTGLTRSERACYNVFPAPDEATQQTTKECRDMPIRMGPFELIIILVIVNIII